MASLLLCGAVSAQNGWDTNPNSHNWSSNTPIVATVSIEGIAQTDLTNLTLGAFAGDELRGRANVANHSVVNVNNSVANDQFWIQVFYNYNTTEAISFKLYDADTRTEYTTCTVTPPTTTQDEGWGTPSNPVVLDFTNAPQTETQTIALTAGTNWFSTYVDITLDDLKAALVEAVPSGTTIIIKSKTQNVRYINGRWIGPLNSFNPAMMYMITVSADCTIELEGTLIDPSTLSITIDKGSNYIAFPYNESIAPANFFGTLPPANGDIVKSKTQNVRYMNGRWIGPLTNLEPGMGCIYVSSSDDGKVFVFPAAQ